MLMLIKEKFETAISIELKNVENQSNKNQIKKVNTLTEYPMMEFHVSKAMRDKCNFDLAMFASTGNVLLTNFKNVRLFAKKLNDQFDPVLENSKMIKAG